MRTRLRSHSVLNAPLLNRSLTIDLAIQRFQVASDTNGTADNTRHPAVLMLICPCTGTRSSLPPFSLPMVFAVFATGCGAGTRTSQFAFGGGDALSEV